MATPTIEAISTQDITIDTDYELEIGITNDPEEVTVGGLLEGFHYSWDADNDTLTIAGEATRLLGDAIWRVSAKETSSSTAVTREITYNVVLGAPIIEEVGEQTILEGVASSFFVKVDNKPTTIKVDGLLTGYKFEPDTNDDDEEGIILSGTLPLNANLTIEDTLFAIEATSDGGTDTYDVPIVFGFGDVTYLVDSTDIFYLINIDGTLLWEFDDSDVRIQSLPTVTNDGIYLFSNSRNGLVLLGTDGVKIWTYEAPIGSYASYHVTSEGIYIFDETDDDLLKISLDGELLWTYNAPSGVYRNIIVGSDGVYLFNENNNDLLKVSTSGSLLWTYNAPTSDYYHDPVLASDGIYLFNDTLDDLLKVSPSGLLLWTYNAPTSGYRDNFAVLDDGIYLLGDDLLKVSTSGSLLWTYNAAGILLAPVVGGDGVYLLGRSTGDLYKINPSTGAEIWMYDGATLADGDYRTPVVSDDGVYISWSTNAHVFKINPSTGAEIWSNTSSALFGLFQDLIVTDGGVYAAGSANGLFKLDPTDGTELWNYDPPNSAIYAGVLG